MIQTAAISGFLGSSFRRGANEEAYRRALYQHKSVQDRERRQKQDDVRNDASEFGDIAVTVITTEQAEIFRLEIDSYQAATIEALQINQEALDFARERLADTLERAHVLEDGRRVFETEDGLRVFDEFGQELSAETITPEDVADNRPRWEQYVGERDAVRALEVEQTDLLEYQEALDAATEQLDVGALTQDQYDDLRADLRNAAPASVQTLVEGMASPESATSTIQSIDLDTSLESAIRPTGLVPGL